MLEYVLVWCFFLLDLFIVILIYVSCDKITFKQVFLKMCSFISLLIADSRVRSFSRSIYSMTDVLVVCFIMQGELETFKQ